MQKKLKLERQKCFTTSFISLYLITSSNTHTLTVTHTHVLLINQYIINIQEPKENLIPRSIYLVVGKTYSIVDHENRAKETFHDRAYAISGSCIERQCPMALANGVTN